MKALRQAYAWCVWGTAGGPRVSAGELESGEREENIIGHEFGE